MAEKTNSSKPLHRGFPNPGPWKQITAELARQGRRPAKAIVGYVGNDAPSMMPLRDGDVLVCDASELSIRQGLTSAKALAVYARRRVVIFSVEGLHAKAIVMSRSAWVGSANASKHSRDELVEASVRVTGHHVQQLRSWADTLIAKENKLGQADIDKLLGIPVRRTTRGPSQRRVPTELPIRLARMYFVETEPDLTRKGESIYKRGLPDAKHVAREQGLPSSLTFIRFIASRSVKMREGDWVVDVRSGRVKRPAVVVRVVSAGRDLVVWMSETRSPRRPSYRELQRVVSKLEPSFDCREVRDQKTLAQVRKLFY